MIDRRKEEGKAVEVEGEEGEEGEGDGEETGGRRRMISSWNQRVTGVKLHRADSRRRALEISHWSSFRPADD